MKKLAASLLMQWKKVGKDGVITVEESKTMGNTVVCC